MSRFETRFPELRVIWSPWLPPRNHRNRLLTLLRCLSRVNNDNERQKDSDWPALEEGRNRRDLPGHAGLHRSPEYDCGAAEVRGGGGKPDADQGRADFRRPEHTWVCASYGRRLVLTLRSPTQNCRCPACASAFACYSPSLGLVISGLLEAQRQMNALIPSFRSTKAQ